MSHWVITYTKMSGPSTPTIGSSSAPENHTDDQAQKIPPKTLEVTKTGKTIVEKITNTTGASTQIWRKDGFILMKSSEKKDWFVGSIPPSNDPFQEADYSTTDFAGLAWISAQNFVGIQTIQGSKCLVFKDKVLALSTSDLVARKDEAARAVTEVLLKNPKLAPISAENIDLGKYKVEVEADIDLKTLLPISLKIGDITRSYKYLPAPDTSLELPEDAHLALTKHQRGIAQIRNTSAGSP